MTTIMLLVRHGQTKSNAEGRMSYKDEYLDDSGYIQAHRLSSRLADLPIASIYTSPLRRAYETAIILNEPHQSPLNIIEDLSEIHLGDWEGLPKHDIQERWPELWKQMVTDPSNLVIPNGESIKELTERAVQAFRNIAQADQGKQSIMVTHNPVISVLVAHVLGVSNSIIPKFRIDSGSLTIIGINDIKMQLLTLNDICWQ